MRILIDKSPFAPDPPIAAWNRRGQWPCQWITPTESREDPIVVAYRLVFDSPKPKVVRIHVTADERYELWHNGRLIGRGSERGDAENWFFETYELELTAGVNVIAAKVWTLGEKSAYAQMSAGHGFLLCPQDAEWQTHIGTGKAAWEAKYLPGYEFTSPMTAWGTGWKTRIHGDKVDWNWYLAGGEGWSPVAAGPNGMETGVNDHTPFHLLAPATLPPMLEHPWRAAAVRFVGHPPEGPTYPHPILRKEDLPNEHGGWSRLLHGAGSLIIPAHARRRILLDLENYVCAYPRAVLSGGKGARLRIHWQESLYVDAKSAEKGNRDQIEGKYFRTIWHEADGVGDDFLADGQRSRAFDTLWWQAGRYVELLVETKDEPLTIEALAFVESRYPYEFTAEFSAADHRLTEITPPMQRTLEMCSHETYMDCPYYEQLQYVGDTRLQVLVTYILTADDRLPRKAIKMFDASRRLSGLTESRYPNRVLQIIPPFSLWWVCMLHDYALWRGDLPFVEARMTGARGVLDAYGRKVNGDGLLEALEGWNFVDWVPGWDSGMPKDATLGFSGVLNLQFIYTLRLAAELDSWLNEPELAARHRRLADRVAAAVNDHFWSEERGLYANDLARTEFSEHAQCLALLSGAVPAERRERLVQGLLNAPDLNRTTVYFCHYLFETFAVLGRPDLILDRMALWFALPAQGLKTIIEHPEPTRSDCHAWGAHPLYHYFATFLGIRPTAPGFTRAEIRPQPGPLTWLKGSLPTPQGELRVSLEDGKATVHLPKGIAANLIHADKSRPLTAGTTTSSW